MIARILGALVRAALVVVAVCIPALLLPNVTVASQEITLVVAGLAAAFTLFEYASTHPGIVDFRFAPPYNRVRFVAFIVQVVSLTLLCRADYGIIEFGGQVERYAQLAVWLTGFPLSPVAVVVAQVPEEAGAGFIRFVEHAAAMSLLASSMLMVVFGLILWILRWPVGRRDFNLWINLPTFAPGYAAEAERRLLRDGLVNFAAGVAALYLVPLVMMRFVDFTSDAVQSNYQFILWSGVLWGFLSGSLIIRGMAVVKVWWLVRFARNP